MKEWIWAPALIATGMILPGLVLAPPAEAFSFTAAANVVVAVGWSGADCVALNEPDPETARATVVRTVTCNPSGGVAISYRAGAGDYIGVDPVEDGVTALACQVWVDGVTVMKMSGYGPSITCLDRLS